MICNHCEAEVRVTHSYPIGKGMRVARGVCSGCGHRYALTTFMEEVDKHGEGARAIASKLKNGKLKPKLEKPE